jgi:hypothetical protein
MARSKWQAISTCPRISREDRRYVAIVCVHPAGGVKEQTAGLYAAKLAEEGMPACLCELRDFRLYGPPFQANAARRL